MGLDQWLPHGSPVSPSSWRARHRIVRGALWLSVIALLMVGLLGPRPPAEGLALPLVVAGVGLLAQVARSPSAKAELISLGVISASFAGVELSGGQIEAHLFILSAVALVSLYQRWGPLLYTIGAVLVHHIGLGILAPDRVFHMGAGGMRPSGGQIAAMVAVHTSAVAIEVVAILLFWHFSETLSQQLQGSLNVLKVREEQLHHQATHDILTGLPNRAMFAEEVSLRLMEPPPFAVLLVDVDDFKRVNDTYGHLCGDVLLESLATRMRSAVRADDLVARLGGDEFAILLRWVTDLADAQRVVDRILQETSRPFTFDDEPVQVSVSIGIAHTQDTLTLQDLMRHADSAMYSAKRQGKARSASHQIPGTAQDGLRTGVSAATGH